MITVKNFVFNNIEENTYVLYNETKECVIIDPGCYTKAEQDRLKNFIVENDLKPAALLNTHCHFDHIFGNAFVCREFGIGAWAHKGELNNINRAESYTSVFGMKMEHPPLPVRYLKDGDDVKFGNSLLKVIHTPGHSPGCVCFYSEEDKFIIAGDTLFQGSIGRTDLPGGDYDQIMDSLLNKLMKLPNDTTAYCGHGPDTEIGQERMYNPFITEKM
ncbi:MAG: MBL fold metallo-hydrolase [Prevotellaceae bacterium]|jgi:glyoxylase-like metal-dependent hydrolase (beta-lactamase superfamily II)|nr:MBL fold metallo-hydrolase [Prevotellaceae bacterium]